jgi:putative SbcD/Mre11-related phosphoesterase
MKIKFLTEPSLLLKNNILVIADLHIGLEYEIFKSGITIPSQIEKLQKRIDSIIKQNKVKHLVILGDVKHQVPDISWQEYREIPEFLKHFNVKITIVKGNHDGNIERLAPRGIKIFDSKGFKLEDFILIHGHAWPRKKDLDAEYLLMGHAHPAVEFWTDEFRSIEPCWLKCKIDKKRIEEKYKKETHLKEAIVMPAFNHLIGGMPFNAEDFEPIGPLLNNEVLKWKEADVYLLDGMYLGKLNKIKRKYKRRKII